MKPINSIIKSLLLAGALAGPLGMPAQAGEKMPAPSRQMAEPPGSPASDMLRGLHLNEVQRDEVFNILHEQAPTIRQKMKSLHANRDALRALALSSRFDEARARALSEAMARDTAELALLRARADQMIYALLTAEQREQLEKLKTELKPPALPHECFGAPAVSMPRSGSR